MKTYFARHTRELDIDEASRAKIWNNRLIAIHYPHDRQGKLQLKDNSSIDPLDYEKGSAARSAMSVLAELAQEGGFVCAQYYGHEGIRVGYVQPNSKIKLVSGKWGKNNTHEGRTAILKTVRLCKVIRVKPSDAAIILVDRPRQGTLKRWPKAGLKIKNLVEGKPGISGLEDLLTDQQEILCSEFLRLPNVSRYGLPRLAHLILPVGRTMKDIDILGVATDGRRIFAQVTMMPLEQADSKRDKLSKYMSHDGSHLILFCDVKRPTASGNVTVFSIRTVFSKFTATASGKLWLEYATVKRR